MYKKLLIPLIIPWFFNFIRCMNNSNYLQKSYSEIRKNAQTIHLLNVVMCRDMEVNIKERLQVCQRIFKLLRDDTTPANPYKHSLYMNYNAFKLSSKDPKYPVCQEKNVWIYPNLAEKYMSLNCYGRLPINSDIFENNKHLTEISFFNGANGTIMVLKCLQSDVDCKLLESYHHDEWHKFTNIPDRVLHIPIPRTADVHKLEAAFTVNPEEVEDIWVNQSNLMNRFMTAAEFDTLCRLLLGRSKYVDKWRSSEMEKNIQKDPKTKKTYITSFEPFVTIQQLHTSKTDVEVKRLYIRVFSCSKYKPQGKRTRTYKIMAGPDKNSVIIIEPTKYKGKMHLVPVELIENLRWDYVLHFEDWF